MSRNHRKRLCIIGTGYVGMACAIGFADFEHDVVGYDVMTERIRELQRGLPPYREAGIKESLTRHLASGRLTFVEDLPTAVAGADYIIVAVGTPARPDGSADLSAIDAVVAELKTLELGGAVVVIRSTVPAGTSDMIAEALRGKAHVLFAPEFLREGSAVSDFLNPDRIVVGSESHVAAAHFAELFGDLECPVLVMSLRDAELAKSMSNAFLAMKVSFANQVANLCDELDGNALDVLDAVGKDRRIGSLFLQPGIGFGGPCFEKDLRSVIHISGTANAESDLFRATLEVNDRQPQRVLRVLEQEFGDDLSGMTIGVWGLAFKAGTDDARDSLAVRIAEELARRGVDVVAYDPAFHDTARQFSFRLANSALDAAEADALLVLTDWPQFRAIDPWAIARRLRLGLVVDGRNILDIDAISRAGLRYRGIGRRRAADASDYAATG